MKTTYSDTETRRNTDLEYKETTHQVEDILDNIPVMAVEEVVVQPKQRRNYTELFLWQIAVWFEMNHFDEEIFHDALKKLRSALIMIRVLLSEPASLSFSGSSP